PAGLVSIKPQQNAKQATKEDEKAGASTAASKSTIDINAVGKYEGKDIFDADLDGFEDKPWRKPGADITDYFNFGFTEAAWKAYINKQKQLRDEQQQKRIHVYEFKPESDAFGFGQGFEGDNMHGGKYQRVQRSNFNQREMNHYGKRPREQDESVIQVLSNDFNDRRDQKFVAVISS
ncbi:cleavage polyadenylation factor subunit fip1, partial [Dinochytrium kinnereticum]